MSVFVRLAAAIDRRWARADRDLARLPELAAAMLRDFDASSIDIVREAARLATMRPLPPQLPVPFGDAQVTVARGRHLLVQLIYWLDQTTAIHQHGFAGAFRVIAGGSLHTTHRFTARAGDGPAFRIGALTPVDQELLSVGDVREIGPGGALIHNLIHLEHPSVTLTVRTPFLRELAPQWVFHRPGVAIDPQHVDVELQTRLRLLRACARLDPPGARAVTRRIVGDGLAASWAALGAWTELAAVEADLDPIYDMIARRHGARGELLATAFRDTIRRSELARFRRSARSRPHRAFLALLADGRDRATVVAAIARMFPGMTPGARVERWLTELARPLGLAIDRRTARVAGRLAGGDATTRIARELRISAREVATVVARLRDSPFAVLAAGSDG